MCTDRRNFLQIAAAAVTGASLAVNSFAESTSAEPFQQREIPDPIRRLKRMTEGVVPISLDERRGRIEKARRLMRENRIDAIYVESGATMFYYTGVRWGLSERMFALVIPQRGDIAWICPKFEEAKARELIRIGNDIRTGKKMRVRSSWWRTYFVIVEFVPAEWEWRNGFASSCLMAFAKPHPDCNL